MEVGNRKRKPRQPTLHATWFMNVNLMPLLNSYKVLFLVAAPMLSSCSVAVGVSCANGQEVSGETCIEGGSEGEIANGDDKTPLTAMNLSSATIGSSDDSVTSHTITTDVNSCIQSLVVDLGSGFRSTNICSGNTIYSRVGAALCVTGGSLSSAAVASEVLLGQDYYNASGAKETGLLVPPTGEMHDSNDLYSGGNRIDYSEATGYTKVVTLKTRVNQGTCSDGSSTTRLACDDAGADWIPIYNSNYRTVLDVNADDEVAAVLRADALRKVSDLNLDATIPTAACGLTPADTIKARINDCNVKWVGSIGGKNGEGDWVLVSKAADGDGGEQVWRDERTKLLWSDKIGVSFDHCDASGNTQNVGYDCATDNSDRVSVCSEEDNTLIERHQAQVITTQQAPTELPKGV